MSVSQPLDDTVQSLDEAAPDTESTRVVTPDATAIREAATILRHGGLVAFPTETVYGLGANALDAKAVARIYAAKGRPHTSPLIVHVPDVEAARQLAATWPESAQKLAAAFWPGPLTLVLPKVSAIPDIVTAGLPSVGLRVPNHPIALDLLREAAVPVAAPSANRFMGISPTLAGHVAHAQMQGASLVLDGGPSDVGLESTVISLTGPFPVLLRPGAISQEQIATVTGQTVETVAQVAEDEAHAAPGMHARHYSPRTPLVILRPEDPLPAGRFVWLGWHTPRKADRLISMPETAEGYARMLYQALHTADAMSLDLIVVEAPPQQSEWTHVWDRLHRAATKL